MPSVNNYMYVYKTESYNDFMSNRTLLNQNGISLLETLLSLSIVSIMSLAIAQMAIDSLNTLNYSESKFDELELARQLQMHLQTKDSCNKNFANRLVTSLDPQKYIFLARDITGTLIGVGRDQGAFGISNFTSVLDNAGNKLIASGDTVGNRSLKITKLDFLISPDNWSTYLSLRGSLPAGSTGVVTTANLQLTAERTKTKFGGQTINRSIPVNVLLDPTGRIVGCYTEADATADTVINIVQNHLTQIINNLDVNNTTINNLITNPPVVIPPVLPTATPPIAAATPPPRDPCAGGLLKPPHLFLYCLLRRFQRP